MSLWDNYQEEHADDVLIEDVPSSMQDALYDWIYDLGASLKNPYNYAKRLRNKFHVTHSIPEHYDYNSSTPPPVWKFANFLLTIARNEPKLFFVMLDFMLSDGMISADEANVLNRLLDDAGHMYKVHESSIVERVPETDLELMGDALSGKEVYSSEFRDAFKELYGTTPDYTAAVGEAFQAAESALKFFFGDDKGKNLGEILNWLKNHQTDWEYTSPSDGQTDARDHFISLVDFVNKSGRKIKHGQANVKLTAKKEHAEVVVRAVALILHELVSTSVKLK